MAGFQLSNYAIEVSFGRDPQATEVLANEQATQGKKLTTHD